MPLNFRTKICLIKQWNKWIRYHDFSSMGFIISSFKHNTKSSKLSKQKTNKQTNKQKFYFILYVFFFLQKINVKLICIIQKNTNLTLRKIVNNKKIMIYSMHIKNFTQLRILNFVCRIIKIYMALKLGSFWWLSIITFNKK